MLKIGVLGAGHLGKIHIRILKELKNYELVGFYDPNPETCITTEKEFGIKAYSSMEELIEKIDVVDIVTSTISHFECAKKSLAQGKHVFIEKPVTHTIKEARELSNLREQAGTRIQIGHVERFNPAFLAAQEHIKQPMFIECHRLAEFNPRGTDVSVILDLMIHDLDILLHTVKSDIKNVYANGVCVVSETPDICNARIEFENGCVANLTASRISMKNMRKTRFFQGDAYISVDYLDKKAEIVTMNEVDKTEEHPFKVYFENDKTKKEINFHQPECAPNNAILEELKAFANSIENNTTPVVSLTDGTKALELAYQITEQISHIHV
ncbi:MAG: Gfo/Idh/MocA family oxidoreductase [Flavobacteriales bacterium]|jgi:predicted dehydrogenase|nr:Gfo/Idh/MocA family oxidoreductase [Flavobacteriales bacterium]